MKVSRRFALQWRIIWVAGIIICCLLPFPACQAQTQKTDRPPLGGPCEYKKYRGEAEIVSISKRSEAPQEFEIKFSFQPRETVQEEFARPQGKTWTLVLKDFSYPKKNFLTKYGIHPGKRLPCFLKAITRGTCTPVLFEFSTIPEGWAQ